MSLPATDLLGIYAVIWVKPIDLRYLSAIHWTTKMAKVAGLRRNQCSMNAACLI